MKSWKELPTWFKVIIYSIELVILMATVFYFVKEVS
jgi:hypothetical protein